MNGRGSVVVAVLAEAMKTFGSITPDNHAEVTAWVRRRVAEVTNTRGDVRPFEPRGFDAKEAAAGGDR